MRIVIQGIADVGDGKVKSSDVHKAVDFTTNAVGRNGGTDKNIAMAKANGEANGQKWTEELNKDAMSIEESRVLKMVKDTFADYFTVDVYEGMAARLESGNLGLVKAPEEKVEASQTVMPVAQVAEVGA